MSSKLGKVIANFNSQLSTKVAVGETTASINSKIDADGVTIPNGRYFVTFDSDNSRKEHFSCVLTTTSSGADLTALKTVNRTTGVETSGALREHKIGAKVTITDYATIAKLVDILNGVETLDGSSPLAYDAQPTLSSGTQLATVQYVLDHIAGGTVSFDQQVLTAQTSGEALTANDIGYFKESDQKWYKADADLTATFDQLQLGIVKSTVAINSGVSIAISGPVGGFTGLTAGSKYYLSNTAGAVTTTAGTYSVFIGWALSTTSLLFNPVLKTLPTQKEKDALGGSSGTPSSTNKYITQDNVFLADADQSQTTQNGSVEIGEADATTKKNKIAQSFIPAKSKIRGVKLYKSADSGTFTGTVTISLQADNAGSPSGSALATQTITNSDYLFLPTGEFECEFTAEYASLTIGSLYWIVIETSTSDNTNHPNLGTNTAGGYGSGSLKYKNTTDGWVAIATIDLYFKTLNGVSSQISQNFGIAKSYSANSVWIKNPNITRIDVKVVGGGGGGGGCNSVTAAGGGGAGAYAQKTIPASAIPSSIQITIGAGGSGGTGANGTDGGSTSLGSILTVAGGVKGTGAGNSVGGAGGAATTATVGCAGGAGANGSGTTGGNGGNSGFATGGAGGVGSTNAGVGTAGLYGAGGGGSGGAGGNQTGGAGGAGHVLIIEYYN